MAAPAQMPKCTYIDLEETVGGLVDAINQQHWSATRTAKHNLCLERIAALLPNGTLSKDTLSSPPSQATMQAFLEELDSLIFRKSISAHCDFVWDAQLKHNGQPVNALYQSPVNGRITIKLHPARLESWWKFVEALLHELCHGWLYLYVCDASCPSPSSCKVMRKLGASGHGWAFQKVGHAVEGFANKHLITRSEISLNRWQAALMEHTLLDPGMQDRCMMEFFEDWVLGCIANRLK